MIINNPQYHHTCDSGSLPRPKPAWYRMYMEDESCSLVTP